MNETDRKKGNTAIFYLPNEFSRDGGKLMGRQSAREGNRIGMLETRTCEGSSRS